MDMILEDIRIISLVMMANGITLLIYAIVAALLQQDNQ